VLPHLRLEQNVHEKVTVAGTDTAVIVYRIEDIMLGESCAICRRSSVKIMYKHNEKIKALCCRLTRWQWL
jgi:hypothetical protein